MAQTTEFHPAIRLPYAEFVSLMAALMALNAMAIDIMLPALQDVGASLGVEDPNSRQSVLTAYILGFGLAQLVYGPLSDRFGRRPVLLGGLAVYTGACLAAAVTTDLALLLTFRAVQGIGAAATRVVAVSVVRDLFGGRRMASIMSFVMMVFMVVPILAPSLGQILLMASGWRWIFVAMALAGLVMTLWSALRLPETLRDDDRRPLSVTSVLQACRLVLTDRLALGYTIATALTFGCLFAFINSAQQIYVETFDLGALFPIAFAGGAIMIAVASFLNGRLVGRLGMRRLSHLALVGFATVSALIATISEFGSGPMSFWLFFPFVTFAFCLFGFIGSNFNAIAMQPLGHVAGTASSVLGFLQTFGGGVLGALVGLAYDGTVTPLALGFLILALAALGAVLFAEHGRLFDSSKDVLA